MDNEKIIEKMLQKGAYTIACRLGREGNEYLMAKNSFDISSEDAKSEKIIQGFKSQLINHYKGKPIVEIEKDGKVIWKEESDLRTLVIDSRCIRGYTNGTSTHDR